jgi:hypothetical protein
VEATSLWWRIVAILATLFLRNSLFPFNSNLALCSPSCSSRISPYLWPTKLSVKCAIISLNSSQLFRGLYTTYCTGSLGSHANSSSVSNPKYQNQSSLQASIVCPGTSQCCGHAHRNCVVQGLLLLRILSYVRRRSCPTIIPSLRPLAPWAHDPLLVELCYLIGCRNTPRDRSSKCFAFAYFRRNTRDLAAQSRL